MRPDGSVDTFLPVGPHVVTRDEIPDLYDLEIATYLNGQLRQHSSTGLMTVAVRPASRLRISAIRAAWADSRLAG